IAHLKSIPGTRPLRAPDPVIDRLEELEQQLRRQAHAYLGQVADRLRGRSLRVTTRVAVAEQPATAILQEAENQGADLIALETHGRGGLSRLFLGSVADKVVRGASVPVLVHRPAAASGPPSSAR